MTDNLDQYLVSKEGCQWMGSDLHVDEPKCGCPTVGGTSWCGDHYWRVYRKGTSIAGKTRAKEIDAEIADIQKAHDLAELAVDN